MPMQAGAPEVENNPHLQELSRTNDSHEPPADFSDILTSISFYFAVSYLTTLSKLRLFIPEDFGTVIIILHGVLHKAEAVHITNKRVAVGPQKVEPAHSLLQEEAEDMGPGHTVRRRGGQQPPCQQGIHRASQCCPVQPC